MWKRFWGVEKIQKKTVTKDKKRGKADSLTYIVAAHDKNYYNGYAFDHIVDVVLN